ncbi:MAG: hypothetical protein JWL85_356 [Candidatus Saccharibacteria bacterium]|nr:hypothetical protein [Candidatus Saccharibacteria bacterium]
MEQSYWQRQTPGAPIFSELLWARPENKMHAGKLLIAGGSAHGFSGPATAYKSAEKAGIGTARVLIPDALKKIIGAFLENAEFAPCTPSGSFSQKSLADFLDLSGWADGTLLAGDFGRNSETAILLEKYVTKYTGELTITRDTVDYFISTPKLLFERPNTTIVLTIAQLQKMAIGMRASEAITFDLDLIRLVERLHTITEQYPASIVVKHLENILVAHEGQVSTTKLAEDLPVWRVDTAAKTAVWRLQNPSKPFEAITTSLVA